jgi:hypothetical protein
MYFYLFLSFYSELRSFEKSTFFFLFIHFLINTFANVLLFVIRNKDVRHNFLLLISKIKIIKYVHLPFPNFRFIKKKTQQNFVLSNGNL